MNAKKAWKKYLNTINEHFFTLEEIQEAISRQGEKGCVHISIELDNHPCRIRLNLKTKRWESALIDCIEQFVVTNISFCWNLRPRRLQ